MFSEESVQKLVAIQGALVHTFYFGSLLEEWKEQLLCVQYIQPEERVLEFGGNIGRCACVIASILRNPQEQFVTIECNPNFSSKLHFNSIMNHFHFTIEDAALSDKPLFFTENNMASHTHTKKKKGAMPIKTIKYLDFRKKYGEFTTLVIDCEGAFFPILSEFPAILDGVNQIIIENDFVLRSHYKKTVSIFLAQGFHCVLSLPGNNNRPCKDCFYQVYQRPLRK